MAANICRVVGGLLLESEPEVVKAERSNPWDCDEDDDSGS